MPPVRAEESRVRRGVTRAGRVVRLGGDQPLARLEWRARTPPVRGAGVAFCGS